MSSENIRGQIKTTGTQLVLNNDGNSTTVQAGSPAANIVLTLPAAPSGNAATLVDTNSTQTLSGKTFTAPVLGAATATSINGLIITPTTTGTLTIAAGKTLTSNASITLAGTDGSQLSLGDNLTTTTGAISLVGNADDTSALTLASGAQVVGGDVNASDIITRTATQTLTNKSLTSPALTTPTVATSLDVPSAQAFALLASAGANTITIGGASSTVNTAGNLVVTGDLTVNGTTTTINTANMTVEDRNITLNAGGNNASALNNDSGLVVEDGWAEGTNSSLIWDATGLVWKGGQAGSEIELVNLSATQTLTNKTLTSPKINENVALTSTATKLNFLTSAAGTTGATSTNLVFSTSPDLTTPTVNTSLTIKAAGTLVLNNIANSFSASIKAPGALAASYTLTLPSDDGTANQVLATDGSGGLSWTSPLTNPMTADQDLIVGTSGGTASRLPTSLLGDILADLNSTTVTMTIATPCVVTHTSHGLNTGDKIYLTTDGALPTGLSVSTTYYIVKVDANSYNLASSLSNALAGTKIDTSGSQSGTHTAYSGGLTYPNGLRGSTATGSIGSGYIGQKLTFTSRAVSVVTSGYTANASALTTLPIGKWLIYPTWASSAGASLTGFSAFIGYGTANADSEHIQASNDITTAYDPNFGVVVAGIPIYYEVTADTPIFAKAKSFGASTTITCTGIALRIA